MRERERERKRERGRECVRFEGNFAEAKDTVWGIASVRCDLGN